MEFQLTREYLFHETDKIIRAITAPQFVEEMRVFKSLHGDERVEFAKERLLPKALENRGVSLPTDMRISSRTFEEGSPSAPQYIDVDGGKRIVTALREKRPDLLERLQKENPSIYRGLGLFEDRISISDSSLISSPDNPKLVLDLDKTPNQHLDILGEGTVSAWACACGGAATACGGAGGGTDTVTNGNEISFDPSVGLPNDYDIVMRDTYNDVIDFVVTDKFKALVEELYELPSIRQAAFVNDVILNQDELAKRGVIVPEGILIQRSSFGDRRPTLFVVKKYLPKHYQAAWENVNITFDQVHDDSQIARDSTAWRKPIPFEVQSVLQALNISPEELED